VIVLLVVGSHVSGSVMGEQATNRTIRAIAIELPALLELSGVPRAADDGELVRTLFVTMGQVLVEAEAQRRSAPPAGRATPVRPGATGTGPGR